MQRVETRRRTIGERRTPRRAVAAMACAAAATITLGFPFSAAPVAAERVEAYAVIVQPASAVTAVSIADLRRIFRGERQRWPDGSPVVVFLQTAGGPGAAARSVVLRVLCQMDERQFTRFWIARTFRDSATDGGPKLVSTNALARRFVSAVPGSVAVIPAADVDGSVRVLRVDGRLPGDEGYPLVGGGA